MSTEQRTVVVIESGQHDQRHVYAIVADMAAAAAWVKGFMKGEVTWREPIIWEHDPAGDPIAGELTGEFAGGRTDTWTFTTYTVSSAEAPPRIGMPGPHQVHAGGLPVPGPFRRDLVPHERSTCIRTVRRDSFEDNPRLLEVSTITGCLVIDRDAHDAFVERIARLEQQIAALGYGQDLG